MTDISIPGDIDTETKKHFQRLLQNLLLEDNPAELAKRINHLLSENAEVLEIYLAKAEGDLMTIEEEDLSEDKRALLQVLHSFDRPVTATEVAESVESDFPEFAEQHGSLTYRSHVSSKLSELVDENLLGKIRFGNTVHYGAPKEAVRSWMKDHGNPQSPAIDDIAEDTGLSLPVVHSLIEEF